MLKELFSSEVRVRLLNIFLMNPDSEYYLRELAAKLNVSPRHVSLELQNLKNIDLLRKRVSGKQHYYTVNKLNPIFPELQNIFVKTMGLKSVIASFLQIYNKNIELAFIYGSMAKGEFKTGSDIDVMIVGEIGGRDISGAMIDAGNELNREINYNIISVNEFSSRLAAGDHFIKSIYSETKIFIIGDQNELERMAKKWLAKNTSDQS